ncbi:MULTISPECIES: transposase [unclassified Nonomuraea]|uniref:transposase n=1 Tax=unclassified Nonomuraea TaxID=2593643 RepID=UPI0033C7EBC1
MAQRCLAGGKRTAADLDAWLCFQDEAGQGLRPPKGRSWGRRGVTPVVTVSGSGSGTVMIAGLIATKPGHVPRLIYRIRLRRGRKGERKSFSETDYAGLLDAAHQQLGGPIVLVWDNLNTHLSARMRELVERRAWLTVIQLPFYAPELNPVEAVWAHLKRSRAKKTLNELARLIKTRLKEVQYRPELISGFIAKTGLDLKPP